MQAPKENAHANVIEGKMLETIKIWIENNISWTAAPILICLGLIIFVLCVCAIWILTETWWYRCQAWRSNDSNL